MFVYFVNVFVVSSVGERYASVKKRFKCVPEVMVAEINILTVKYILPSQVRNVFAKHLCVMLCEFAC